VINRAHPIPITCSLPSVGSPILRRGLPGEGLCAGLGEFEADEPVAGGAVAVEFGGGEFPTAGGLDGEVSEIFAGARSIELGGGDVARGLDVNADGDADFALDSGAGFVGDVGQNLIEDFPMSG
jgi:hypothetical protein